jgi:hypothetical protein
VTRSLVVTTNGPKEVTVSARLHSMFFHRLSVPAWVIAVVVAAALAAAVPAFLLASDTGSASAGTSASAVRPDTAGNAYVGASRTSCIDNAVVGHC